MKQVAYMVADFDQQTADFFALIVGTSILLQYQKMEAHQQGHCWLKKSQTFNHLINASLAQ